MKRFKVLIRVLALQKIWVDSVEAGGGGLTDMRRRRRRRGTTSCIGFPSEDTSEESHLRIFLRISHLRIHLKNPI